MRMARIASPMRTLSNHLDGVISGRFFTAAQLDALGTRLPLTQILQQAYPEASAACKKSVFRHPYAEAFRQYP